MTIPTIPCAIDTFLAAATSRSRATANNYRVAINFFLATGGGTLDTPAVTKFLTALNASKLQASSRATHISAIRTFLGYCEMEGLIPMCPVHLLKRPHIERARVAYLTPESAEILARHSVGIPKSAIILMLGLGLRASEAIRARWRDIYREGDKIGLQIPNGKGGRARVAVLPADLLALLQQIRIGAGLPPDLDPNDATPILHHGTRRSAYTRQALHVIIAAAGRAANLPSRIGPHTLRHSFCTIAARIGTQPYDLQEAMGHAKLETTMFYVHLIRGLTNPASGSVAALVFKK